MLEAFQQKVTAAVPVPPGAVGIPDYSEGEAQMPDKVTYYAIIERSEQP